MGHWLGLLMDIRTANNLTMAALRVMAALLREEHLSADVEHALNYWLLEVEGFKQGAL